MDITAGRETSLGLLDLPAELRSKIYDHLFHDATLTFEIHPESIFNFDKHPPFWVLLPKSVFFGVLLACRKLYHETEARRFALRSWHFVNAGGLEVFNRFASKPRKATVHRVSGVRLANYRYKAQLCQLSGLKCVHLGPLSVHHSLVHLYGSGDEESRFDSVGWRTLIYSVNQAGLDWIAPYGLEPLVDCGRWDEFTLSVDFDIDELEPGRRTRRRWLPTRLDVSTKKIVRFEDQVRESKGLASWPQLRPPPSPSPCVLAQFEDAKSDLQASRDRWRRYMTVE